MSGNPVRTGSDTANSVRKKVRMNLDVTDKENSPKDEELENPVIPGSRSDSKPPGICKSSKDEELENPVIPGSRSDSKPPEICIRKAAAGYSLVVPVSVNGVSTQAVVDTAAQVTLISEELLMKMSTPLPAEETVILREVGKDSTIPARIARQVPLRVGNRDFIWDMYVAPISDMCLLGLDFFKAFNGRIDLSKDLVSIGGEDIQGHIQHNQGADVQIRRVTVTKKVVVPPNSMKRTKVKVFAPPNTTLVIDAPQYQHKGLLVPYSVVTTPDDGFPGSRYRQVVINLINDQGVFRHLNQGHIIGEAEEVSLIVEDNLVSSSHRSTSVDESSMSSENISTGNHPSAVPSGPSPKVQKVSPEPSEAAIVDRIPIHLQDPWKQSCDNLTAAQSSTLADVLIEYADVFSKSDTDLGCFSEIQHHVDTGAAKPIRQKMRRTPINFESEEKDHLDSLLSIGVIQPSSSDWASPPVLVRKKDGKVRWCIDYRALNNVTVKDAYPLPNISECLDSLGDAKFFSTLDMSSGYYQIEIAEEDRAKTAFLTKYGLFEHSRMPFGLCNAPATFQRAMSLVLRGLTWNEVLAYLDDIILVGRSFRGSSSDSHQGVSAFSSAQPQTKSEEMSSLSTKSCFSWKAS